MKNSYPGETAELLAELVRAQRRTLRWSRLAGLVLTALLAAALAALAVLIPPAMATMQRVDATLSGLDAMVRETETMAARVNAALEGGENLSAAAASIPDAVDAFTGTMDAVSDTMSAVSGAMEQLNSVDFRRLNQAIDDLADVVEPLKRFAGFFGG